MHIQGNEFGPQIVAKICQNLGYKEGKLIKVSSTSTDRKTETYHLNPSNNGPTDFCLKTFSEILDSKDFDVDEISKIEGRCMIQNADAKQHVQIECTKKMVSSLSLAAQSACDSETCPTGFSKRQSLFCLPNRCQTCLFG